MVVSSDSLNEGPAGTIVVIPITRTYRGLPSHIEVDRGSSGLDEVSYAKYEDVKSVSEQRLIARLGVVGGESMFQATPALRFLLDL